VTHGKFGNLHAAVVLAHGSDQLAGANISTEFGYVFGTLLKAVLHCFDNLVEG
jgi:hypothetical protein